MTSRNFSKIASMATASIKNKIFMPALLTTLLILMLIIAGCGTETITYETVNQKDLNLSFERPDDWTDEKVAPGQEYIDYTINIPGTPGNSNRLNGTLAISVINAPADTLLKLEEEVGTFKNLFKDSKEMKILSETDTTMLGEKAKEVTMAFKNAEDANVQEKVIGTVAIRNNKVYVALLDEEEGEWNKYLPVYQKLRDTLRPIQSTTK